MGRTTRLALVLVATLLALVSWVPRSHAVGNSDAAGRAGAYVAAQAATTTDVGVAADSLLALAAVDDAALAPQAAQLLEVVRGGAATYAAASPVGAAKLVLVAVALGQDPADFAGVDLVAAVKAGLRDDGSFGEVPGPYASALGMIALTRAQEQVPPAMARFLVRQANPDGGFGSGAGKPSDAESTGLAMLGMLTQTDSISARDAVTRAIAWAVAQQLPDGSWRGEANDITATAQLGSALQAAGQPQPRAVQYLVGQQLADGAFPEQGQPSLLATQQATLLLADTSYLSVGSPALARALAPSATPSPSPSASPSASPTATEAAPTAPPAAPRGGDNGILWVILPIVLLMLLTGAGFLMFGRPGGDLPSPAAAPATPEATAEAEGTPANQATDGPARAPAAMAEPSTGEQPEAISASSTDEDAASEFGLSRPGDHAEDPDQRTESDQGDTGRSTDAARD
nr:hypothetical protein [Propionibacterium sp.]